MISILVEDKKLSINEKEQINSTNIEIEKDKYVVTEEVTKFTESEFYSYEDYDLFASVQHLFNEKYLNFFLYNGQTNKGYKLLGINGSLELQIKRLNSESLVVVGQNKDLDSVGQVSFCNLLESGEVNELVYNFNKLKQVAFVGKRYVLLNYFEVVDDGDKKEYLYTIAVHKPNGSIEKVLLDEKTKGYVDYYFEVKAGVVTVIKKKKDEKTEVINYSLKNK
ncbi:MAG: hypothetical protein ACI4T8_01430 [Christensenellales bacterium]